MHKTIALFLIGSLVACSGPKSATDRDNTNDETASQTDTMNSYAKDRAFLNSITLI